MLRDAPSAISAPSSSPATTPEETAPGPPRFPRRQARARWYRRIDPWQAAPIVIAAIFSAAYLIWQPRTVDLAAHTFRADLFGEQGFTIWNGQWYGGHHTPAYSVL